MTNLLLHGPTVFLYAYQLTQQNNYMYLEKKTNMYTTHAHIQVTYFVIVRKKQPQFTINEHIKPVIKCTVIVYKQGKNFACTVTNKLVFALRYHSYII